MTARKLVYSIWYIVYGKKQTERGYTLVELLVVIAVISILGVVSFSRPPTLKEDRDLKNAANELQSIIRTAQTNATSSVKCTSAATGGSNWSLEFTALSVDLICSGIRKTLTFSNNVKICKITYSGCATTDDCTTSPFSATGVSTSFAQLSGEISFTDLRCTTTSLDNSSNMVITLQRTGGMDTKSVTLTKGGSVEIR